MSNNHLIIKSIRKQSSFLEYRIRARKDTCLHDDVEDFMTRYDNNIPRLVDKLLTGEFVLERYTDPTYPVK